MTPTHSLASHAETVLRISSSRVAAIRNTISLLERARNKDQVIAALAACAAENVDHPKHGKSRMARAAEVGGSVLAGMGTESGWIEISVEVCADFDTQHYDWLEDAVSGGLVDGADHPWKKDHRDASAHRNTNAELNNHSGSVHFEVLRALDVAKAGNSDALFSDQVLNHMALRSKDELAGDPEIAQIKAEMKAARLPLKKWLRAVSDRRLRPQAAILYRERRGLGPDTKSRRNVEQFLKAVHASVWFDDFNKKTFIEFDGKSSLLDDDSLLEWMFRMRETGLPIDKEPANDALTSLAKMDKRHPVRDYLHALKWDGKKRVDTWLHQYAGAQDTELNKLYGRKFLVGAVRRILRPGTKLRAMPILEGEQNIGKSLVFKTLAVKPEWYTDSLELGCDPKEVIELTEGKWIVETPELSGMSNRDVEHVKAMISRDVDKARLAYGRHSKEVPRQFVLGGTTNTEEYLKDRTGNTRFWGVKVSKPKIKRLERDRDQLWAEAVHIEATGEAHWLETAEAQELARMSAQKREEQNPLEQTWIATFERVKTLGNVFVSTEDMYRSVGLDAAARLHQGHKNSLRYAAKRAGWVSARKRIGDGSRPWGHTPGGVKAETASLAVYDRLAQRLKTAAKPRSRTAGL